MLNFYSEIVDIEISWMVDMSEKTGVGSFFTLWVRIDFNLEFSGLGFISVLSFLGKLNFVTQNTLDMTELIKRKYSIKFVMY